MTLAQDIVARLSDQTASVTFAESCTGGLLSAAITDIPGSSAVFERGFVTYSNQAKQDMLGVSAATLEAHGAVSEPVTHEMAVGARAASGADYAVSVSGIAGPGGSEFKPEGRVCFGLAHREGVITQTVDFGALGRDQVRRAAVATALEILLSALR